MASVRKIKNGYLVRWEAGRDATGRRLQDSKVVTTRQDADRLAAEMKLKREGRGLAPERGLTVGAYLDRWIEKRKDLGNGRRKTLDSYARIVAKLDGYLGSVRLDQLDAFTIESAIARLAKSGGRYGKVMAPNTVRNYFRVLDKALKDAVRWKLIVANPCDGVERPKGSKSRVKAPTAEEAGALLRQAEGTRYYAFAYLALATGLRLGELLGLRWQDVDHDAGLLSVNQTVQEVGSEVFIERPKTETSSRQVTVGEDVLEVLSQHKAVQSEERLKAGDLWEDNDLVFPNHGGVLWRPCYVSVAMRRLANAAGIPKEVAPVHGLRHGHATLLYSATKDVKAVQSRLGHASPLITMSLYVHSDADQDKESARIATTYMKAIKAG